MATPTQTVPNLYRREYTASGAGAVPASSIVSAAPPIFPVQWQIGGVANYRVTFTTGVVSAGTFQSYTISAPISDNNFPQTIRLAQNQHAVCVASIYLNPVSATPAHPLLFGVPTFGLTFGSGSIGVLTGTPGAAITFNGPCTLSNPGSTFTVVGYSPVNSSNYQAIFTLQVVLYGATY